MGADRIKAKYEVFGGISFELLEDGTLISYGINIESEMIAKEMGFEPHWIFDYLNRSIINEVRSNSIDNVELLIIAGANIHGDFSEYDALVIAAMLGNADIVNLLLEYGADVHAQIDHALRAAAAGGYEDVVKLLLEYGADVHANEDQALRTASARDHVNVVKILLEAGADVHVWQNKPLYDARRLGNEAVVAILEDWIKDHG